LAAASSAARPATVLGAGLPAAAPLALTGSAAFGDEALAFAVVTASAACLVGACDAGLSPLPLAVLPAADLVVEADFALPAAPEPACDGAGRGLLPACGLAAPDVAALRVLSARLDGRAPFLAADAGVAAVFFAVMRFLG
jgi:hypothetical protein